MSYATPQNVKLPPDCVDVMNDSEFIAQPIADEILFLIQAVAGDDYPLQWRLLNRIKKMFERHFTWERIQTLFLIEMMSEVRDEIRKLKGDSNLTNNHTRP
ncbi:MAG: hypothetical protein LCI00_05630 [Chloroflexi bacterium]|nr:hypothetical protein [Chloroflexota bacterium]